MMEPMRAVEQADVPMAVDRGALVVSLDLELLWGYHDIPISDTIRTQSRHTREAVRRLLDVFGKYDIPATWAIVGHLYLEGAERDVHGRAHPHHPRPSYPWMQGDWFARLPEGDASRHPEWYGRDLVEMIRRASPTQEVACHTFSHVVMGEPGCDEAVARAELQRCIDLARAMDIDLKTIIFPRNKVGHLSVVREAGFEVFRGRDVEPFSWVGPSLQSKATILSRILSVPPPPVLPTRTAEGLINLPGSMFYMPATEWQRYVPMAIRTVVAKRGLREAARQKAVFHLRLHPEALVFGADRLFAGLEEIFREANRLEQAGALQRLTVHDAAFHYLGSGAAQ